jgi:DNA helicase-2/ATP-dependent DNA helicase PcrA
MNLDASHLAEGLNASQKQAVMTTEGPLLVVAGPGTGKTLTIVRDRVPRPSRRPPETILAVTFTNRARDDRACRGSAERRRKIFIGTFHLLGSGSSG